MYAFCVMLYSTDDFLFFTCLETFHELRILTMPANCSKLCYSKNVIKLRDTNEHFSVEALSSLLKEFSHNDFDQRPRAPRANSFQSCNLVEIVIPTIQLMCGLI